MSKIDPALTPKDWTEMAQAIGGPCGYDSCIGETDALRAYCIAVNNAALSDSDPRKITRETIALLRAAADRLPGRFANVDEPDECGLVIAALADALESYLPPNDG